MPKDKLTAIDIVMELSEEVNQHRYKKDCSAFYVDKLEDRIEDYAKAYNSQVLEDIKKEIEEEKPKWCLLNERLILRKAISIIDKHLNKQ